MAEKKKAYRKVIFVVVILVSLIAIVAAVNLIFRPMMLEEVKFVTIKIVGNEQETVLYEWRTDAEYLLQVLEEVEGLELSRMEVTDGVVYGTINGETTSMESSTCWIVSINGERCDNELSKQPVNDGDNVEIMYVYIVSMD